MASSSQSDPYAPGSKFISRIPLTHVSHGIPRIQIDKWIKDYPLTPKELTTLLRSQMNDKNGSIDEHGNLYNVISWWDGVMIYDDVCLHHVIRSLTYMQSTNAQNLAKDMDRYLVKYCQNAVSVLESIDIKLIAPSPAIKTTQIIQDVKIKGCSVCKQSDNDTIIFPCCHIFCYDCVLKKPSCPSCLGPKINIVRGIK